MLQTLKYASTKSRAISGARFRNFARFNSSVIEAADLKNFTKLINETKPTVVDFYATWCGPCKAIAPVFDALAQKVPEAQFVRVDVDAAEDVAREYGITAMPTLMIFKDGEKQGKIIGANLPKLVSMIEEHTGVDAKTR